MANRPSQSSRSHSGRDRHAVHVVAFHPRAGQQTRKRQIARVVPAQQGQLPGIFLAVHDADVGAGDGLDAYRLCGLVELDQGEQVVAVGHGQRGQLHFHRATQHVGALGLARARFVGFLGHADGRIREREFGMQVEVDETRGHARVRVARGGRAEQGLTGMPRGPVQRFRIAIPARNPGPMQRRTGAKLRRCCGQGPWLASAARCEGVE